MRYIVISTQISCPTLRILPHGTPPPPQTIHFQCNGKQKLGLYSLESFDESPVTVGRISGVSTDKASECEDRGAAREYTVVNLILRMQINSDLTLDWIH